MTDWLPLSVFPQGALSSSVITTVWIGVWVVALANLRLGWVLSGLVVPGYLVPLLLVKPWVAVIIVAEGILTYLLVHALSNLLARLGLWGNFFGRDRFFALVLVSVLVRLTSDAYLLPALTELLHAEYGLRLSFQADLQSYGLVIVALVANLFWKTGLLRGLLPLATTIGVTFLVVRYGLMELTNFGVSNLSYLYEDLAASIEAGPKAYMVLIITALVASRMNLRYGWDFNGILLPSLLALQWYQPEKILTSFIEALIIYLLADLVLRLPLLRGSTIEGARKLLLFFNISFAYKLLLGYALVAWAPEVKVTDYYGFGYLLPTLLALKMHDKEIIARVTRATLQTSLVAAASASAIGFALTLLPPLTAPAAISYGAVATALPNDPTPLLDRIRADQVRLFGSRQGSGLVAPTAAELDRFSGAISALLQHRSGDPPEGLEAPRRQLAALGYELIRVEDRYLYLIEPQGRRGWGLYVIDPAATGNLLIEVPAALDERGTLAAAAWLFTSTGARALAIAGAPRRANPDGSADLLAHRGNPFHAFHRLLDRGDVLQLRSYTPQTTRALARAGALTGGAAGEPLSQLWVHDRLPPGLDLAALRGLLGHYGLEWRPAPLTNLLRDSSTGAVAELYLNRAALRRLLAAPLLARHRVDQLVRAQRLDGYLQEWLTDAAERLGSRGSDGYRTPTLEQLLFLDEEVFAPLLTLAHSGYVQGQWTTDGLAELDGINAAAALFDYQLIRYRHSRSGQDYLILAERGDAEQRRYWGTYVLRLGETRPYAVQVPRPGYEIGSLEYGTALFERLQGSMLMIGGSHPLANRDGSADLTRFRNRTNVFNLAQQVVQREHAGRALLTVQARAFGLRSDTPPPQADVLISWGEGDIGHRNDALAEALLEALRADGLSVEPVTGTPSSAGYEALLMPQQRLLETTRSHQFAAAWLSPLARQGYRDQSENALQQAKFDAVGIPSEVADLPARLQRVRHRALPADSRAAIEDEITAFRRSGDIVILYRLSRRWPELRMERIIEPSTQQALLLVQYADGAFTLAADLAPQAIETRVGIRPEGDMDAAARRFLAQRASWLEVLPQ